MNISDKTPKISKHYATPKGMPELFLKDGTQVYIEHRHLVQWYLKNDYNLGAATKYVFRVGQGGKKSVGMTTTEKMIDDLKKAQEYISFKIEELEAIRKSEENSVNTVSDQPHVVPVRSVTQEITDFRYPIKAVTDMGNPYQNIKDEYESI